MKTDRPISNPQFAIEPMRRLKKLALFCAAGVFLLSGFTHVAWAVNANLPGKMAFQGFLTDATGKAYGLDNAVNLSVAFRIYNSPTATTSVWGERQVVTVDKGHFSVVLGEGTSLDSTPAVSDLTPAFATDNANGKYLGVQVGTETEMSPRIQFFTAPYAFVARYATELVGTTGSSILTIGSDNKVGINVNGAPSSVLALDVNGTVNVMGFTNKGYATVPLLLGDTKQTNGSFKISKNNALEMGADLTKEASAGKLGYSLFGVNNLDIVGAGTTLASRSVKIWAENGTTFTGPVTGTSFSGDGSALTGVAKLAANTFTGYQEMQNDLRVGANFPSGNVGSTINQFSSEVNKWGSKLYFSGASQNGENNDTLYMARYNNAFNATVLRVSIGSVAGSLDAFQIGTTVTNQFPSLGGTIPVPGFSPAVTINAAGEIKSGRWKVTDLSDKVGPYPMDYSYTSGGGTLAITVNATGWSSPLGFVRSLNLAIDGAVVDSSVAKLYFNQAGVHMTLRGKTFITTLAAGVHKFTLTANAGLLSDINDSAQITVVEYPF